MDNSQAATNWHILADRFVWSDETALSLIPQEIEDNEIQKYLYTFHGDSMTLQEVQEWRNKKQSEKH